MQKTFDMKKWIIVILGYAVLIGLLFISFKDKGNYEKKWKDAVTNVKAYDKLLSNSNEKNVAYKLTAEQLSYANDSILKELNDTRKKLKVKDKNLKSVQYITSTLSRVDTITLKDTIFKEPVEVDTIIGDKWYNAKIALSYPSTIIVSPTFKSEKNIVVSTKKETVNPPKKFWLFRLFQKKHTVIKVDIIEKNPYVSNEKSRYIEIIK